MTVIPYYRQGPVGTAALQSRRVTALRKDLMIARQQAAPLRQEVGRLLRQDIVQQVLRPGERLLEGDLCSRYGVSRTVIREALRQLESESLITLLPNRGPIVTVLSAHDIKSIYEVRQSLEGLAGALFATRASATQAAHLVEHVEVVAAAFSNDDLQARLDAKDEFYRLLLEGAGNEVLAGSLRGIHTRIGIFRHYAFVDKGRLGLALIELRSIVEAAAVRRDPEAARRACEDHIRRAADLAIIEYQSRLPGGVDSGDQAMHTTTLRHEPPIALRSG
jgi:DNA-binding GntR family transcriptional regulator